MAGEAIHWKVNCFLSSENNYNQNVFVYKLLTMTMYKLFISIVVIFLASCLESGIAVQSILVFIVYYV